MKEVSLILIIFLFSNLGYGQSQLKGLITDSKTGLPISNAEVMLMPGHHGTSTNSEGVYSITNLNEGEYQLTVYALGYVRIEKAIELKKNDITNLNFSLKIDVKELLAVEIVDDHIDIHAYSKVTLKNADLDEHPVRDIGDYLREVSNIHAVRKGGGES